MDATQTLTMRQTVNLSDRHQIVRESYRVGRTADGQTAFEIRLANIAAIDAVCGRPTDEVTLRFRPASNYGFPIEHRVPLKAVVKTNGLITGVLEEIKDLKTVECDVFLRSEDAPRWKAKGDLRRPDRTDFENPEEGDCPTKGQFRSQSVRSVETTMAPTGSLIHMVCKDEVSGFFDVMLRSEEGDALPMPLLVLNTAITAERLRADKTMQALIFPEVVRKVITAMALHPEAYDDAVWFRPWAKYAVTLIPFKDQGFGYFRDHSDDETLVDPEVVHRQVRTAVQTYVSQMKFALPSERVSTDED
jgi:hypothetical protein